MKTVLCFGDSNTYGYNPATFGRYEKEKRWTGILADKLGPGYTVTEEGCNGRTTVYKDTRDPWVCGLDYLRQCLISHKPVDTVVLMLGTNDLKTYLKLSAQDIACGVRSLVKVIKEFCPQIQGFAPQILLVSPPLVREGIRLSPFYPDFDETSVTRSKELGAEYKLVAEEEGCIFLDAAYAEISTCDHVHLTEAGHRSLAEAIYKTLEVNNV